MDRAFVVFGVIIGVLLLGLVSVYVVDLARLRKDKRQPARLKEAWEHHEDAIEGRSTN